MNEKTENQQKKEQKRKEKRTFPVTNTIWLVIILVVQIGLVIFGFTYDPEPQDVIHQYRVEVTPLEDGSLDIEYFFEWEVLDPSEPLNWVEIGMANQHYTVYHSSVSDNILWYHQKSYDGDVYLQLDFRQYYHSGDTFTFSFKINQKKMLCKNGKGYFYEFVPCWFNAIEVENYEFVWHKDGGDQRWQGSLGYGEYCKMFVQYDADAFAGCQTVKHENFNGSGAYNQLRNNVAIPSCIFAALLIIGEVYIVDSYVSYKRGVGFMTGYGSHVHVAGRTNPRYIRARQRYFASSSSGSRVGGRSGGCACACACACAGGGRAGCSQKDTFGTKTKSGNEER